MKKFLLSRKSRDRLTLRLEKITLDEHYARWIDKLIKIFF